MARKADIKKCRYSHCKHDIKDIDISCDEYVVKGSMYYHKDCYKAKLNCEWKDEKTKKDLVIIRDLWYENISKTVVYSQLYRILNDYIERGVESEYLVFVMRYCLDHKCKLNYPNGFKFYVDRQEIKDAYAKSKIQKIDSSRFSIKDSEFEEPEDVKTSPLISKPKGFGDILK